MNEPAVLRGRPEQAAAWASATAALPPFGIGISGVRVPLTSVLHIAAPDELTLLTGASPAQLTSVRVDIGRSGVPACWKLASNGVPVEFVPNVDELRRRLSSVDEGETTALDEPEPQPRRRKTAAVT